MSLEATIQENTAVMKELIATLRDGSGKTVKAANAAIDNAASGEKPSKPAGRKPAEPKAETPKFTFEQVKAAAVKVKDELGTKTAKQLIADHGADELAKLKPENFEAFIAACEKALAGEDDTGTGDGEDGL